MPHHGDLRPASFLSSLLSFFNLFPPQGAGGHLKEFFPCCSLKVQMHGEPFLRSCCSKLIPLSFPALPCPLLPLLLWSGLHVVGCGACTLAMGLVTVVYLGMVLAHMLSGAALIQLCDSSHFLVVVLAGWGSLWHSHVLPPGCSLGHSVHMSLVAVPAMVSCTHSFSGQSHLVESLG